MGLRLEIVSRHTQGLGERSIKEFGHEGGTIGRSLESDWVLPDGQRYLSSRHASIDYRSGSYYIIDTSRNGVYVNGSERPLGRGHPQRLFSNDKLRIGEYVMRVTIDDSDSTGEQLADAPHVDPADAALRVEPADSATDALVEEHEITGVGLDLLLDEDQSQSLRAAASEVRFSDEFDVSSLSLEDTGYTNTRPDPSAPIGDEAELRDSGRRAAPSRPAAKPAKKADESRVERMLAADEPPLTAKPAPDAAPAPARRADPKRAEGRAKPTGPHDGDAAFNAFLTGAGLEPLELKPGEVEQLMHTLGRVMRETITGLTEGLHLRAVQKSVLRQSNTTIRPRDNNPLKFTAGVDESLKSLMFGNSSEYLQPVDAVRGAFKDLKLHQQALLRALYTALERYVERLDPDQVEEQCSSGRRGALLGAANKLKYWDYYKDLYLVVAQHPSGELPPQFLEELAQAYEEEIEKSAPQQHAQARQSGVG